MAVSYKDYRRSGREGVMRLAPHEFIRRFLLHVLPDGFHRIRRYGFLAKVSPRPTARQNLARARELLEVQTTNEPDDEAKATTNSEPETGAAHQPFAVCPDCGGLMRRIGRLALSPIAAFRCDTS